MHVHETLAASGTSFGLQLSHLHRSGLRVNCILCHGSACRLIKHAWPSPEVMLLCLLDILDCQIYWLSPDLLSTWACCAGTWTFSMNHSLKSDL